MADKFKVLLVKHGACQEIIEWVGDRSMARAWKECPRSDWMLWLSRILGLLTERQLRELAVDFAEHILPIFEKQYPTDRRPRLAIQAARDFAAGKYGKEILAAHAADADHAGDAAQSDAAGAHNFDAAHAAHAASRAAYAASAAASAYIFDATHAGYHASYAAYSADADHAGDAAGAYAKEKKWQADQIRKMLPRPKEHTAARAARRA